MIGHTKNQSNSICNTSNNGPRILYLVESSAANVTKNITPYLSWHLLHNLLTSPKGSTKGSCSNKNGCNKYSVPPDPSQVIEETNQQLYINNSSILLKNRDYSYKYKYAQYGDEITASTS